MDAAIILYFLPFLYMYAAVIRLASRPDRKQNSRAVLIPGGRLGVAIAGGLGFAITAFAMVLSLIPTGDVSDALGFELKVLGGAVGSILVGLALYRRGRRRGENGRI